MGLTDPFLSLFLKLKMIRNHTIRFWQLPFLIPFALALTLGTAWFLFLHGYQGLAFWKVGWIYNAGGDLLQHYLGWEFFRSQSWVFPFGKIVNDSFPNGNSLTYADSIPLISIPLKIISPLLSQPFQYFGIWVLLDMVAQVWFAILIIRIYSNNLFHQIVGSSLLVLSPILIIRALGHTSLHAQWLLLAAIYLILIGRRKALPIWCWPAILSVAILIHQYLCAMVEVFFVIYLVEKFQRTGSWGRVAGLFLGATLVILVIGYLSGAISGQFGPASSFGYGLYSMNLNALYNPLVNSSAVLKEQPVTIAFQWEGYNYLGLGYLFLLSIALAIVVIQLDIKETLIQNKYIIAGCILLTLFAITNRITFNDQVLLQIPVPQFVTDTLGIFRSSGRFFWSVYYLLIIFAIICVIKARRRSTLLLSIALIIQFFDIHPLIQNQQYPVNTPYQSPLKDAFWKKASGHYGHIILLPAFKLTSFYEPFGIYAAENQMTINYSYLARADYVSIYNDGVNVEKALKYGKVAADTISVFCRMTDVRDIKAQEVNHMIQFYQFDRYVVGLASSSSFVQNTAEGSELSGQAIQDPILCQ